MTDRLLLNSDCPMRSVFEDISKKWAALIIILLAEEPLRFSDLLQSIDGVSQKMLTQALRMLERDGLVSRTVNANTIPISVTYALTSTGTSLAEPMRALRLWAEQHADEVTAARLRYDGA